MKQKAQSRKIIDETETIDHAASKNIRASAGRKPKNEKHNRQISQQG